MDGIQMAVKIACSRSFSTNHRYAEIMNEIITARMIKKSDVLNIKSPSVDYDKLLNSSPKQPIAESRQPVIATVPTTLTPAVMPNANTSRLIIPIKPSANPIPPTRVRIMPMTFKEWYKRIIKK
jgi:hypothetical protein